MMNDVFRTVIAEGIVVVYLDDILIFTKTKEEHERAVRRVLEILAEHKLFLHPEKCEFHRKQIEYLELVILENKVAMDPVKVAGVREWPVPENRTDVQAFIGFVNFYCRFIQDFSTIAQPLFDLTRSNKAWNWGTKEQEAFECLKMAVTTAPILASPRTRNPSALRLTVQISPPEPSSLSNYPEKKNGTQWLSIVNPCLQWNGTTRSMTKRCSLSSVRWKSGGTFWKELAIRWKSGQTTRTWSTS